MVNHALHRTAGGRRGFHRRVSWLAAAKSYEDGAGSLLPSPGYGKARSLGSLAAARAMTKQRFSLVSVIAMILTTWVAFRTQGHHHFDGWFGFPFRSYWWRGMDEGFLANYNLPRLFGNIGIWLVVIFASGFLVEWLVQRFYLKLQHEHG
jgi:hypothetical protein